MPNHRKSKRTETIPQRSLAEAVNKVFNDISKLYRELNVSFIDNQKAKMCNVIILHHKLYVSSSLPH